MTYMMERGTPVGEAIVEEVIPVIPAGVYPARFAKIEARRNEQGDYWHWTFVARNTQGEDVEVTATTSPRITPRTKAAKWLGGLGIKVDVGTRVDFDSIIDTVCQIVVVINEQGYSRIESVLPYPQSAPGEA